MRRLKGWPRLWLVGLVPWILLNISILAEYIDLDWLTGWWKLLGPAWGFYFDTGPEGRMLVLVVVGGILVPYIALYYGVKVAWRAAVWIRAGFQEGKQHRPSSGAAHTVGPVTLAKRIEQSENLIHWLDRLIEGLSIPSNDRAKIATSCLDVALEHYKSIVLTTTVSFHGSAFALVRLEFEAYIRGVWLLYCASDDELERFKEDKLDKSFGDMIADLEALEAFNVGVLSKIKRESWQAMNSFSHTGLFQVVKRSTATKIISNYPAEEIVGTLDIADSIALLVSLAVVDVTTGDVADKEELARQLLERMKEFAGTN